VHSPERPWEAEREVGRSPPIPSTSTGKRRDWDTQEHHSWLVFLLDIVVAVVVVVVSSWRVLFVVVVVVVVEVCGVSEKL